MLSRSIFGLGRPRPQENANVTKKEIVKKISEDIGLTQLKTKDIVQRTLDAIIDTLVTEGRIELRNFGVFEVKQRKARKARNPRTGEKVDVPPKNVVTFKPGKEMEERVRQMTDLTSMDDDEESLVGDGVGTNQAFFNVNDLFTLADTGNFTPQGEQTFTLKVLEPTQAGLNQTFTLTFSADFATALSTLISLNTDLLTLQVGSAVLRAGQTGSVPVSASVNTNLTSIDLTLQIPPGHLTNLVLQSLTPALDPAASTVVPQGDTIWKLHLAALSGQTIIGSNILAQIGFTTISNQTSAFVPLQVTALDATKSETSAISRKSVLSGRVVVIANQSLLEAGVAPDGSRQLTLYGKAWMSYAILYSTNLIDSSSWSQVVHFAQTNIVTVVAGLGSPAPNAFYRALEFTPDPPVLDAVPAGGQKRTLLGYGQSGLQYTLLARTNLSNVMPWTPVQTYMLTNSFHYFTPTGSESIIFYRLQRN